MNDLRTAAQQALEALAHAVSRLDHQAAICDCEEAITALRAALAQKQAEPPGCDHCRHPLYAATRCRVCGKVTEQAEPVQEPVAWVDQRIHGWPDCFVMEADPPHTTPLYTAPPQRSPLTEELVTWGVDWGRDGDQSCVSIIKKHADGTIEVVAVEYAPAQRPAEPVQEPVAFIHRQGNHWEVSERHLDEDERDRGWTEEPLYTAPPQRSPLTEEEAAKACGASGNLGPLMQIVRAIERAHGIGDNT